MFKFLYYFVGVIIFLIYLSTLFHYNSWFRKYWDGRKWFLKKYKKHEHEWSDLPDEAKNYIIWVLAVFLPFIIWSLIGFFTYNWILFIGYWAISFIIAGLTKLFTGFGYSYFTGIIDYVIAIGLILFSLINSYHLHIDLLNLIF